MQDNARAAHRARAGPGRFCEIGPSSEMPRGGVILLVAAPARKRPGEDVAERPSPVPLKAAPIEGGIAESKSRRVISDRGRKVCWMACAARFFSTKKSIAVRNQLPGGTLNQFFAAACRHPCTNHFVGAPADRHGDLAHSRLSRWPAPQRLSMGRVRRS